MVAVRALALSFLSGILFTSVAVYLILPLLLGPVDHPKPPQISRRPETTFQAPALNVWKDLDGAEATVLHSHLHDHYHELGLGDESNAFGKETLIDQIEVLRPNKTDATAYLDGSGARLGRHARVSIVHTKDNRTRFIEYMVGPLPPSNLTTISVLTYPHKHQVRSSIDSPITDIFAFFSWTRSVGESVADITSDLLGAVVNVDDPDDPNVLVVGSRPTLIEDGQMVHWLQFYKLGSRSNARSLLPQGLYVKLYCPSSNPETWTTGEWFYNNVIYDNLASLRRAWRSPDFIKLSRNSEGLWTDTEDFESNPAGRSKPPPLSIQPHGGRYDLDRQRQYLSWMGFTFYVSTSQSTALSLFDIRYNDTRLIYHMGLQEALAHYAGSEPMQSGLEFLDTFFGMGNMMFSLVPGHDCPAYADYLDMTYSKGGKTFTNKNAICIFEFTSDAPLQRHTAESHVTVSRNTYLVVRSVSTVGNYDYTIDYLFYLDGSIEVKVRASGYIFGAYSGHPLSSAPPSTSDDELRPRGQAPEAFNNYSSTNPNITNTYGYAIHPSLSTSMHDHVLLFRCDLDISPTPSYHDTFTTVSITPHTQAYPWDHPEAPTRNTMHLTHTPLTTETGLNWPPNSGSMYLIQSNSTNKWNERKSYRIQPGTGMGTPSHLTIHNSTSLGKSASWSSADLWVLKQKDFEPMGAHYLNYLSPHKPLVDFEDLANSETLHPHISGDEGDGQGDDLVIYFNLGGHHVPSSSDIPNTLMHTSASSVVLSPFNYFDEDVSVQWRQGVRVDGKAREGVGLGEGVRWFGGRYGGQEEDEEMVLDVQRDLEPSLEAYFEEAGERTAMGRNRVGGGLWGLFGGSRRED